ncbi:MAG: Two component multi-sensor signal transduction histidine kinase [Modestobacter sp.]|nr:Two component multi-sensor signal transduction histidine kinase [Modestobacter sp.]
METKQLTVAVPGEPFDSAAGAPPPVVTAVAGARRLVTACVERLASVGVLRGAPAARTGRAGTGALRPPAAVVAAPARTSPTHRALLARIDQAQERLAIQEDQLARYAAILSATDDAIITVSLEGLITSWNSAAEELYGLTESEVLGRPVTIFEGAGAPDLLQEIENVAAGGATAFETVHLRGDGSTVETSWILSTICDRAGLPSGVVGVARDIGDQRTRDAEFHQESKLESLGRLSAGLAHEINSPIQFVGDNARFLEEAYEELIRVVGVYRGLLDTSNPIGWMERQERVREAESSIDFDYLQKEIPSAVAQTLEGIERVSTIVRAMKTFSHPGHKEHAPADLNEAMAATVTVARHQIREVADLSLQLSALPPVRCNIADLNQVFLNLIVNAADAIEETGQRGLITVATAVDGEDVVIRIGDTGGGIPDDVRAKMFDPFFTTKDVGRGSGQGLALARGVVQEGHGGGLTVDSVLGQGSTFTVRIPISGLPQESPVGADLPGSSVSA